MSTVHTGNGTEPGTDSDMVRYNFSGSPNGLYEHMPEVGEHRVMTVTVECTSAGHKKNRDGSYPAATWALRELTLGREVDPPSDNDPNQITVDEALEEIEGELEPTPTVETTGADEEPERHHDDPFAVR